MCPLSGVLTKSHQTTMRCAILRPQLDTLPYLMGDILSDIPAAVLVSRFAMAIANIEE